ncbi:MAG: HDIG domain-containing protein, partial [Deltaproteobacteria bacterium]|nr:HDIG domain-containing protein [Deltaproteobacteria bacterium]
MKKIFIKDIRAGDLVDDIFVLSEKTMAQKRDGNNFLNIAVSDNTGNIKGVIWDRVDDISAGTASGDFVQIQGTVSEYKGKLQLVVKNITTIPADSINPSDFLPATRRDIDKMFLRLLKITASLEAGHLKKLFEAFFNDTDFVRKFKNAPAAKKMHHAYIGGLLEHTLSMALLADRIAGHYSGVDRDLLLAGAILHDIGKIREFNYKYSIDYSDEGRLLSHIV